MIARGVGLFLAVFAPLAVLASGVSYFWRAVEAIPLYPQSFRAQVVAGEGRLDVRLRGIRVDLGQRTLQLDNAEVRDEAGGKLASALSIKVELQEINRIHSRIAQIDAIVERDRNGRLTIERYLRGPKGEPTDHSFSVQVQKVNLDVIDRGSRWRQRMRLQDTWIHGWRDRIGLQTSASAPGIGTSTLNARSSDQLGTVVWGQAELSLARLIPVLRRLRETRDIAELRRLDVKELIVRGPFELRSSGSDLLVRASIEGEAKGLRYEDFRLARGEFTGWMSDQEFRGRVNGRADSLDSQFDGVIRWGSRPRVAGDFEGSLTSLQSIPRRFRAAAADLQVSGARAEGWLDWSGNNLKLASNFRVARLRSAGETVRDATGLVVALGDRVGTQVRSARWRNTPVSGWAEVHDAKLAGSMDATSVNLDRIGVEGLRGRAAVRAIVGGTTTRPNVSMATSGRVSVRNGNASFGNSDFTARATFADQNLQVQRAIFSGKTLKGAAHGGWRLGNQAYVFKVLANEIALSQLDPTVYGLAFFGGSLSGRGSRWQANGQLEGYGVEIADQSAEFVTMRLEANSDRIQARQMTALASGARANGWLDFGLSDQSLRGKFDAFGIDLAKSGVANLIGVARIREATVFGTLSRPKLTARVEASKVVVQTVPIETASGWMSLVGPDVTVTDVQAEVAEGSVSGQVTAHLGTGFGTFQLNAHDVELNQLLPKDLEPIDLAAKISGAVRGNFGETQILGLEARTDISRLTLNGSLFGSGPVSVKKIGENYEASVFLGQLDQFIEMPKALYRPGSGMLEADLVVSRVPISQIYAAFSKEIDPKPNVSPRWNLDPQIREKLSSLRGLVTLGATTSGLLSNPVVDVQTLELNDLSIQGVGAGKVIAKFNRADEVWNLDRLEWTDGPGTLQVSGSYDEQGQAKITGSLRGLELNWFSWLEPQLGGVPGTIDSDLFTVEGNARQPTVSASLTYSEVQSESTRPERQIDLLARLTNESLSADGTFFGNGFTGPIELRVPFRYETGFVKDEPVQVEIKVDPRKLTDFQQYLSDLDSSRTRGSLAGVVRVGGTLTEPTLTGEVRIQPTENESAALAFKTSEIGLEDLRTVLSLEPAGIRLNASASGSAGGKLDVQDLGLDFESLPALYEKGLNGLLASTTRGKVVLNAFQAVYRDAKGSPIRSVLDGEINVSETLAKPLVKGQIYASKTQVTIPELTGAEASAATPRINPSFDLRVDMADPVTLNLGSGTFTLLGHGELRGNLTQPKLDSLFVVQRGFLRLPNARIKIEPEGEVRFQLENNEASANLNVSGTTAVTAQGLTGTVSRYQIELDITGNVLTPGGLNLAARSDPPDLSQDQILALLGQRELITGIAGAASTADQIQSALVGVAVPYVASAITDRLAENLGLDYLNVEYNAFDRVSISAGLLLGRHLTLSGRRQVSAPLPGEKTKFDLRLSYRPPFGGRFVRRLSFSLGIDQDRPWKLGVEYGLRF